MVPGELLKAIDPFAAGWVAIAAAQGVAWLLSQRRIKRARTRGWVLAHRAFEPPGDRNPEQITVVSYNILADGYCMTKRHDYCPKRLREWERRLTRLKLELRGYDADLLCLQEVEKSAYGGGLGQFLKAQGYRGVFYLRAPQPASLPSEGCAVFYHTKVFELEAERTVRLRDLLPPKADNPKAATHRMYQQLYELSDGAAMAVLRHRHTGRRMLAVSVHLFWDPFFPHVKVMQAALLCEAVQAFRAEHGGDDQLPVVLCGDLNSMWRKYFTDEFDIVPDGGFLTGGVFELLSTGRLPRSHHEHPAGRGWDRDLDELTSRGLAMDSAWAARNGRATPALTTRTEHFSGAIDYVCLSRGQWKVESTLRMPYPDADHELDPEAVNFPPIPNAVWPSDHLAVGARIAFC